MLRDEAQLELVKALANLLDHESDSFLGATKDVMRDVAALLFRITGATSPRPLVGPLADNDEFIALEAIVERLSRLHRPNERRGD